MKGNSYVVPGSLCTLFDVLILEFFFQKCNNFPGGDGGTQTVVVGDSTVDVQNDEETDTIVIFESYINLFAYIFKSYINLFA